jgi:putative N6-adenine-specific DNA methylase
MELIVTTLQGLEDILFQELEDLGAQSIQRLTRAIKCEGDEKLMYKINYQCRTALRVLIPLGEYFITSENDIYNHFLKIDWEQYFDLKETFAIHTVGQNHFINNTMYTSLRAKDAIADQFRDKYGKRPNVNPVNPTLHINIHIRDNTMTVSLDSSGDSLHMRGYRIHGLEAPLNEVLAAGVIMLTGWKGETKLVDPMCGSGTFGIEAYRIARNIPPQNRNREFDFKSWKNFNEELWQEVVSEADAHISKEIPVIEMFDKSMQASRGAAENIMNAGIDSIEVKRQDFFKGDDVSNATIIVNPPYDIRLKEEDILDFYFKMGTKFKDSYTDCVVWVFSGHIPALKGMPLKPSKKISLMNADIDSKLYKYEIYEGIRG